MYSYLLRPAFLQSFMDVGVRAPTVGALGDKRAIAEELKHRPQRYKPELKFSTIN